MTPAEHRVMSDLLTVAKTRRSKRGHLLQLWPNESLGVCNTRIPFGRGCSPLCIASMAAITAAEALLAETERRTG